MGYTQEEIYDLILERQESGHAGKVEHYSRQRAKVLVRQAKNFREMVTRPDATPVQLAIWNANLKAIEEVAADRAIDLE